MAKRKLGDILLDLEDILDEMYLDHDMQVGDVMALVYANSVIHYPDSIEEYNDGTNPTFKYGHRDDQ